MKLVEANEMVRFKGEARSIHELLASIKNGRFTLDGRKLVVRDTLFLADQRLTSLLGCPQRVYGNFNCTNNELKTLEGAPQEVTGTFDCSFNKLVSLKGAPRHIGMGFWCQHNLLRSLEGGPITVGGLYNCSNNLLTSLIGCAKTVKTMMIAINNHKLTSLEGGPSFVGDGVRLQGCMGLTTLRNIHLHLPEVHGSLYLDRPLKHLLGLLLIKGLQRVVMPGHEKLEVILNKYLPGGDLITCAIELTEAGYEEQAKL